jgi:hypothetical protein
VLCGGLALLVLAAVATAVEVLPSGIDAGAVEQTRYLDYARRCADVLIERGTDRYGAVRSPLLVSILDVRTGDCPPDPAALDEAWRVERRGRRNPAGANLYTDQPLLRALYTLSRTTGDDRYAAAADASAADTMSRLVDDQGLFWWGWHRHYDVFRDVMTGHNGEPHEIHIQAALWPELWRVNPAAVTREIEAVWQWHVIDKATGECNRHADGQPGCDFAMSGGEILAAFAFMHQRTHDSAWLDRTRLVADYYWKARHPTTGLPPNRPNAGAERFDGGHFDTSITAFLCRGLLLASQWTGEPVFRQQAVAYLKAYGKYGYDSEARRFWGSLKLDGTPVPGPRTVGDYAQFEPRGHIDLWQPYAAGYEHAIATALIYACAAETTGDQELLATAKRWADMIRAEFPPRRAADPSWYGEYAREWAPHGTYAAYYGQTISLLLHLHRATGDQQYLDSAREVARESVAKLYYEGLFRGHPCKPYYEAIDGVGYLLLALVQLDQVLTNPGSECLTPVNW